MPRSVLLGSVSTPFGEHVQGRKLFFAWSDISAASVSVQIHESVEILLQVISETVRSPIDYDIVQVDNNTFTNHATN